MSDNSLLSARGCYYHVRGNPAGSFWSISPSITSSAPVLIQRVNITGQDAVAKNVCFNDTRLAAAASRDFGRVEGMGYALLGSVDSPNGFGADLKSWFDSARIFKRGAPCMVSSLSAGAHSFLAEYYSIGEIINDFNIQTFSFGGSCLD